MTYGEMIKQACAIKGITSAQLERDLQLSNGFISKQKDKIKPKTLVRIADRLSLSAFELVPEELKTKELEVLLENVTTEYKKQREKERIKAEQEELYMQTVLEAFTNAPKPNSFDIDDSKFIYKEPSKSDIPELELGDLDELLIDVGNFSPAMQQACIEKIATIIMKFKELDSI